MTALMLPSFIHGVLSSGPSLGVSCLTGQFLWLCQWQTGTTGTTVFLHWTRPEASRFCALQPHCTYLTFLYRKRHTFYLIINSCFHAAPPLDGWPCTPSSQSLQMEVNVGYASLWQKSSKSPGVEVSYTDAFRSVLRRIATPEPVIGIVVQGPARTGKSTYLNLLVRFLVESIAEK